MQQGPCLAHCYYNIVYVFFILVALFLLLFIAFQHDQNRNKI